MGDDWPRKRYDLGNTGHTPASGPESDPSELWRADVQAFVSGEPVVVGDRLYVATMSPNDPNVATIENSTGEILATSATNDPLEQIRGSVAVADGLVYVPLFDFGIGVYEADTGERSGRYDDHDAAYSATSHAVGGAPRLVEERIYDSGDYRLNAFEQESGELLWSSRSAKGNPAIVDGTVYNTTQQDPSAEETVGSWLKPRLLEARDADSGRIRWRTRLPVGTTTPVVTDGMCFVAGSLPDEGGAVCALDVADGDLCWQTELPTDVQIPPAVGDSRVVAVTNAGVVTAVHREDGRIDWQTQRSSEESVYAGVVIADGVVYAGVGEAVYAFDLDTGVELWEYPIDGNGCAPVVAGGVVYVQDGDDIVALS
jgi:outer membrane protein assembly factor BamB